MNYYGKRYIEAENFAQYFIDIVIPNEGIDKSKILRELEYWEKNNVFFPIRRLVEPDAYTIFMEERYDKQPKHLPEDWPQSIIDLYQLYYKVRDWDGYPSNELEHPYDDVENTREFFEDPKTKPFQKWNSRTVAYQRNFGECTTVTTKQFYHYWQLYFLDGIRKNNCIEIISNNISNSKRELLEDKEFIENSFIYPSSRPFIRLRYLRGQEPFFELLSKYIQTYSRKHEILKRDYTTYLNDDKTEFKIDTIKVREGVESFWKEQAAVLTANHKKEELLNFIRNLCQLFFEYRRYDNSTLADQAKMDTGYMIELYSFAYKLEFRNVVEDVGYVGGYTKPALDVIFPDVFREAKENSVYFFREFSNKDTINELCNYLEDSGLDQFFVSTEQFYEDIKNRSHFYLHNRFTHLRNICIVAEDFIKVIGINSCNEEVNKKFNDKLASGYLTLKHALEYLFEDEQWWEIFKDYPKATNPNDVLSRFKEIFSTPEEDEIKDFQTYPVKDLLVFYIMRNYTAHIARINIDLYKEYYQPILDSTIKSMLYIWEFSKQNNLLATTFDDKSK